ncbi:CK1 family protein kinase [Gracilaria domingensis]|nr:CK1 family protein kinase [Gracilaria domingensis]
MLRFAHSKGLLHSDVKPKNIMVQRNSGRPDKLFLTDFGMAKSYLRDDDNSRHVSDAYVGFYGTPHFASPRAHEGRRQSRRDDLKSLTYMLVYLANGSLPWGHLDRMSDIHHLKRETLLSDLCSGIPGLRDFALNVWRLSFEERPDYRSLSQILHNALIRLRGSTSVRYDWE